MASGSKKKPEAAQSTEEIVTPELIALRRPAVKALAEAIALDRPYHVWENGKIVNIGGGQKRKQARRKPAAKDEATGTNLPE